MLRTTIGPTANKLIFTGKGSIKKVNGGDMDDEASVVYKANTRSSAFKMRIFTLGPKLAFVKLR